MRLGVGLGATSSVGATVFCSYYKNRVKTASRINLSEMNYLPFTAAKRSKVNLDMQVIRPTFRLPYLNSNLKFDP